VRYVARQDYEIGGHSLQQNIKGHPVIFYRFPARLVLPKGCSMTVWAQQAPANQRHSRQQQKSIEMVNKGVEKWLSDAHCTTVLCQSTGQVGHTLVTDRHHRMERYHVWYTGPWLGCYQGRTFTPNLVVVTWEGRCKARGAAARGRKGRERGYGCWGVGSEASPHQLET